MFSQFNQGPSAARNRGIELAIVNYMIFADVYDKVSKSYVMDLACLIQNSMILWLCGDLHWNLFQFRK